MNGTKVKRGARGLAYDYYHTRDGVVNSGAPFTPYFVSPKGSPVNYVYVYRGDYGTPPVVFPTEEAAIAWMDWMFMLKEDKLLKESQKVVG